MGCTYKRFLFVRTIAPSNDVDMFRGREEVTLDNDCDNPSVVF